jgi:hypothetical protein
MARAVVTAAALAEDVGLCWSRWHLAIGFGRADATMVSTQKYIGYRLRASGASTEGLPGFSPRIPG